MDSLNAIHTHTYTHTHTLASSHALSGCDEFFFFFLSSVIIFPFLKMKMDKFALKTWISRRVFYFIGILSGVGDIFLPGCPQVPIKHKV